MNLKKTLPTLTLALVMLFTVTTAMAQPKDKQAPPPVPAKAAQMSAEDQAAMKALWKEHRQKMAPVRDQFWAKQMEYDALVANQNSKHQDIQAVIEDMKKLRAQMRDERTKFHESMEAKGFDLGHGRHWPGFDEDRGCGKMRHNGPKDFGPGGKGKGSRHHGERMTD